MMEAALDYCCYIVLIYDWQEGPTGDLHFPGPTKAGEVMI